MYADVIGMLTEVSDTYTVNLPNKFGPTLTKHFILRDLKYVQPIFCLFYCFMGWSSFGHCSYASLDVCSYSEVKVCLWGERASAFVVDQAISLDKGKPVVVLLVGGVMKKYQGTPRRFSCLVSVSLVTLVHVTTLLFVM